MPPSRSNVADGQAIVGPVTHIGGRSPFAALMPDNRRRHDVPTGCRDDAPEGNARSQSERSSQLQEPAGAGASLCQDVAADFLDPLNAGQRHADVEFLAKDVNCSRHSRFTAGTEPEYIGATNQTTLSPSASARSTSCPERMPPSNITSISDPAASTLRRHGGRGFYSRNPRSRRRRAETPSHRKWGVHHADRTRASSECLTRRSSRLSAYGVCETPQQEGPVRHRQTPRRRTARAPREG